MMDLEAKKLDMATHSAVMVLLVDDQAMVGEAVRRALLNQPGIDFHYCADPAKAVAVAEQIRPTVILQDLVMPGIDGLTLVRRYRANSATSDIPIVVLSTTEDPAVKGDAFAAGANDYLVKLPSQIELVARIRYHSKAYLNQLQRDEAYRALRESQQQLTEMNIELQRLTNVDGLTEICNRRHFNEHLQLEWSRSLRDQSPLSVLMIDIDDFKQYNDTYGHLGGDEALKKVASTLQLNANRSTDLVARYGGEEFALVMTTTPLTGASFMAGKLRAAVRDLQLVDGASAVVRNLTVSVGGASTIPQRGGSSVQLIEAADKALYEAKRSGKNREVMHEYRR
ncbi:diguanylate cyclase [Rhizobacter sp. Root1221]|uniref:diguanylate cyclase n=1 Tax=Rhizobacter sp. Root1221 TaxID=1736433 RepID=UPI000A9395DA|nr:diguanylate cyclase [Rhizobacter sp. Root1221]